jgi:hypothetical protein
VNNQNTSAKTGVIRKGKSLLHQEFLDEEVIRRKREKFRNMLNLD